MGAFRVEFEDSLWEKVNCEGKDSSYKPEWVQSLQFADEKGVEALPFARSYCLLQTLNWIHLSTHFGESICSDWSNRITAYSRKPCGEVFLSLEPIHQSLVNGYLSDGFLANRTALSTGLDERCLVEAPQV